MAAETRTATPFAPDEPTGQIADNLAGRLRAALRVPAGDGGDLALTAALRTPHPADIADAMDQLARPEALAVFNWVDNARAAEVLDELDSDLTGYLVQNAPPGRIADLLDRLPMDDAAEVVAEVGAEASPEEAAELLHDLERRSPEDAAEVRELLSYGENTAGRLMTDQFVRLSPGMTVEQALVLVRQADTREVETLIELYVVERTRPAGTSSGGGGARTDEILLGVVPLPRLVRARPGQSVRDVMIPEPMTVSVDMDQQEVARRISKYDFLAMPVVDRGGFLAGIVTVDDAMDVLADEFNEDYMKLVGSDAEEIERRTPLQVARLRLPWLLGTMVIELFAGGIIHRYNYVLETVVLLASFMPVISAISGNIGLQAAAIMVRGLATGHVNARNMGPAVTKELATSLIMALVCGVTLGTVAVIWSWFDSHRWHFTFGLVIGGAMVCSMITAGLMGTIIPMTSKRLGFDPATTAGPFETAFQDVVGFGVFLWLASLLLPYLK